MTKQRLQIFITVISCIISLTLLSINGPKHNFMGLKLFLDKQDIVLAYQGWVQPESTVYLSENERFIKGVVDETGLKAQFGDLKYSIEGKISYRKLFSMNYYLLSILLIIILLIRRKHEKIKQRT